MGRLISVLAVLLTSAAIALSADLFRMAGLSLYTEQVLAGLLAIATPLVFLHVSAAGERGRAGAVPWYDAAAAVAGFTASAYLAIRYAGLSELTSKQPWDGLLAAGVLLVLFLEGLRRTSGAALFYTTLAFIVLAMFGGYLPGEFAARSIPLPRLAYYLGWDSSAILGIAIKIIAAVVDLEAAKSKILPMPREEIPRLGRVLREGWYFLLPLAALVYSLFGLNYEPEMAGLVATAIVLALGVLVPFRGKRIGFRDLAVMLRDAGIAVLDLLMLGAAAGIMIGALTYSCVGFTLTLVLILLAGGSLVALLVLSAAANILLGLGLPTVGVYIVLATLVAPALVKMGIAPMAAHMFIMYYGCLSMISPPVAIAAFVAANLAGADPNRTGWVAMAFGWTLFVIPFLFVFSGTLLLKGDPLSIAVDLSLAVAGVWFISAAMMGYAARPLGFAARVCHGVTGLCLFMPANAFGAGRWINAAGAGLAVAMFVREKAVRRRAVAAEG